MNSDHLAMPQNYHLGKLLINLVCACGLSQGRVFFEGTSERTVVLGAVPVN